jgi:AP-1 complex subunit gamma-1
VALHQLIKVVDIDYNAV